MLLTSFFRRPLERWRLGPPGHYRLRVAQRELAEPRLEPYGDGAHLRPSEAIPCSDFSALLWHRCGTDRLAAELNPSRYTISL